MQPYYYRSFLVLWNITRCQQISLFVYKISASQRGPDLNKNREKVEPEVDFYMVVFAILSKQNLTRTIHSEEIGPLLGPYSSNLCNVMTF